MKLCHWLGILGVSIALTANLAMAQGTRAETATNRVATETQVAITLEDVIKMVQLKFSDDLIIAQIRKNESPISPSTDQMIRLKTAGASDNLIRVMLNPLPLDLPAQKSLPTGTSAAQPKARPQGVEEPILDERAAQKLYDRGCVLSRMGLWAEAVRIFEEATSRFPSIGSNSCGTVRRLDDITRDNLKRDRAELQKCIEWIPDTTKEKKAKTPIITEDQKRQRELDCNTLRGNEVGNYSQSIEGLTRHINDNESSRRSPDFRGDTAAADKADRGMYEERALSLFASGNSLGALRDLQTSMDLYKRYPDKWEYLNYFYRAVIFSEMGNVQGAMNDCKIVLTFQTDLRTDPIIETFCRGLTAAGQIGTNATGSAGRVSDSDHIRQEIQEITQSGKYLPLPPIQSTGTATPSNGLATFNISNDTAYLLTVLFSGPMDRRVEVPARGTRSIELTPGSYKVVGRVDTANVLPSYGEHVFSGNASGVQFFIQ